MIVMLNILFERYKSKRLKYHLYYERHFFNRRFEPLLILQVGLEPSLQAWQKYFTKSRIYCIDSFIDKDPKDISYLDEERIHWARCDLTNQKHIRDVMINIWNKPRFDIIIDNITDHKTMRHYCIGKYYKEVNDEVFCHSC